MLEAAITLTNDKGIMMDMQALGKVIMCARDLPKLVRGDRNQFKGITLNKWVDKATKGK